LKVFDGSAYLKSKEVEITLSNGKKFTVCEIAPETMEKFSKVDENAGPEVMRELMAEICNGVADDFKIGSVEMRGVMDFLLESLFAAK